MEGGKKAGRLWKGTDRQGGQWAGDSFGNKKLFSKGDVEGLGKEKVASRQKSIVPERNCGQERGKFSG